MLYHADLHWHDFKLLADFLADRVFAAAADARQLSSGSSWMTSIRDSSAGSGLRYGALITDERNCQEVLGSLAPRDS